MYKSLKFALLFLVTFALFFSCNKNEDLDLSGTNTENVVTGDSNNPPAGDDEDEGFEGDCDALCFELNYPVEVVLPDGMTETANDDDELEMIFETWYDNNPDSDEEPDFVYPIEVTFEDGTVEAVENIDEFELLLDGCFDDEDDEDDCDCEDEDEDFEDCFTLNYPVDIILPDGNTLTANDGEELEMILETWYDNNPDSEDHPTFNFPIEVTLDDGTIVTVNDDLELDDLFEDCFGDWDCDGLILGDDQATLTKTVVGRKK